MPILDLSRPDDSHSNARLLAEPIIWFGSTRQNMRPHHVPVWFAWQDPLILIFSQPATVKLRNIARVPSVWLSLDSAERGQDIVMAEGEARRADAADAQLEQLVSLYAEKYRAMLPAGDLSTWRQTFSEPIVVQIKRIIAWTRTAGELHYRVASLPAPKLD